MSPAAARADAQSSSSSGTELAPFKFRPGRELGALLEVTSCYASLGPQIASARRGDGHAVLALPGFMSGDGSTRALRLYLAGLGYRARGWDLGRNKGFTDAIFDRLAERLQAMAKRRGPVSLIGHSLGGIYARLLARELPEAVRFLIQLGSAFNIQEAERGDSAINSLYDRINPPAERSHRLGSALLKPPVEVPSTSIYSRRDGIVPWRGCCESADSQTENLGVRSTHIGMPFNPAVLYAIADRLAQPADQWQAFDLRGARRFIYEVRP